MEDKKINAELFWATSYLSYLCNGQAAFGKPGASSATARRHRPRNRQRHGKATDRRPQSHGGGAWGEARQPKAAYGHNKSRTGKMKILIVEDNDDLREVIVRSLEKERYVAETAACYADARTKAFVYEYDCILLDIMLPDVNGLELLRELHAAGRRVNVIILSAKDSIEDKVKGLELGADDYLPKPFHLAELHARIKSVLRRQMRGGEQAIRIANVTIHPDTFGVDVGGKPLELSRKEYDIMLYLVNRQGRLIEKQTLAEAVWGDDIDQADNFDFIYAQMKNLRKRLKAAGAGIEIKTVYGFGYKLVET